VCHGGYPQIVLAHSDAVAFAVSINDSIGFHDLGQIDGNSVEVVEEKSHLLDFVRTPVELVSKGSDLTFRYNAVSGCFLGHQ
jgi:hypothetical protein